MEEINNPFDYKIEKDIKITSTPEVKEFNNESKLSQEILETGDYEPSKKKLHLHRKPHESPKKRLEIPQPCTTSSTKDNKKAIFRYGNYSRYYGYRNTKDFHDVRLDIFQQHKKDLFTGKDVLDIGCNSGLLTMAIAKDYAVRYISAIDIDKSLINRAQKFIEAKRREYSDEEKFGFPFNITFVHGNYVVRDEVLLEIEESHFDLILCLSVTKWIHLNFGDAGLKLAFKRMYRQLRNGGHLILEPQPWSSYKRRKKLTDDIFTNFKSIKFLPEDFSKYLLSEEIGFSEVYELKCPEHCIKGFRRPIYVFIKK